MSAASVYSAMTAVTRKVAAYFAPAITGSAVLPIADPANLPAGWIDMGWIENLRRTPGTRIEPLRAGPKGATVTQIATELEARVEFDFLQWGKFQMAVTGCGPHLNLLAAAQGVTIAAVPLLAGSSATELQLAGTGQFLPGDLLAVDVDYTGQTGYVGAGISGAYISSAENIGNDTNYIRRITFNVGRASAITPTSVILEQPLLASTTPANASVQKVVGFMDRDGGGLFQEWSAIFVVESEFGGRISFQYPRLEVAAPAQETRISSIEPMEIVGLHASFRALPQQDPSDHEQVLCYRNYLPAPGTPLY